MDIAEIEETFALLDDWEERYTYLQELGRLLPTYPDHLRNEQNFVSGCQSKVWISTEIDRASSSDPILRFMGDSDSIFVRGLVAIAVALYSDHSASEILAIDANEKFAKLNLRENLTRRRSDGLAFVVRRIRADAETALAHN